jgi:hypothetical protein
LLSSGGSFKSDGIIQFEGIVLVYFDHDALVDDLAVSRSLTLGDSITSLCVWSGSLRELGRETGGMTQAVDSEDEYRVFLGGMLVVNVSRMNHEWKNYMMGGGREPHVQLGKSSRELGGLLVQASNWAEQYRGRLRAYRHNSPHKDVDLGLKNAHAK